MPTLKNRVLRTYFIIANGKTGIHVVYLPSWNMIGQGMHFFEWSGLHRLPNILILDLIDSYG
jgi:hypothetical protein